MRKSKRDKPDATGRNPDVVGRSGWRLQVMRSLWLSPLASAMSVNEKALFWELTSLHTGKNNGTLFLSVRDATYRMGLNDYAAAIKAIDGLIGLGLITVTAEASFNVKASETSRARAFRLNWIDEDGFSKSGDAFSLDMATISPCRRKRVERRMKSLKAFVRDREKGKFAVGESPTMAARMEAAASRVARDPRTLNHGIGQILPSEPVRESPSYLDYQPGRGPTPADIMHGMRGDPITPPLVRSPTAGHATFCQLIAMRRSIIDTSKKSGPRKSAILPDRIAA